MKYFEFKQKQSDKLSDEQLFWKNLKIADEVLSLNVFVVLLSHYFKMNPDKNYHDLEKELRQRDFNAHLIASSLDDEMKEKYTIIHPSKEQSSLSETLIYRCLISCREKKQALSELLTHSSTYEENLEKLKVSGNLCIKQEIKQDSDDNVEQLDENIKKLSQNELELVLIEKTDRLFIKELIHELKRVFPDVKAKTVATSNDLAVVCFFSNDVLVSKYGYSYDPITDEYKIHTAKMEQ